MKLSELAQYENSVETDFIDNALQFQTDKIMNAKEELLQQLNVESATWGLELWEKIVGTSPNASDTLESRRMKVTSRLRGRGTATVEMMKTLAESFVEKTVEIVEHCSRYLIEFKMISDESESFRMFELIDAIEKMKPAHLAMHISVMMFSSLAHPCSGGFVTIAPKNIIYPKES